MHFDKTQFCSSARERTKPPNPVPSAKETNGIGTPHANVEALALRGSDMIKMAAELQQARRLAPLQTLTVLGRLWHQLMHDGTCETMPSRESINLNVASGTG